MNLIHFITRKRHFFVFVTHLVIIVSSYLLAFCLRFDGHFEAYYELILQTLIALLVIKIIIFHYFQVFTSSLRYASIYDLWQVLKANTSASIFFIVFLVLIHKASGMPRSIFFLDWGICLGLTTLLRFLARVIRGKTLFGKRILFKKTLIIGAGEAGIMVLREYQNNPGINAEVVGFIDDDKTKKNIHIHGVMVYGGRDVISEVVEKFGIQEIVIAIPSASGETIRDIIVRCDIPDVKVKMAPGFHKILSGELEIKLREVRPEDLLGRQTVKIDEKEVSDYLQGKRILVTGAAGSIGSELCRQIATFVPRELVLFDHNENDIYFLELELKSKFPNLEFSAIMGDVKDPGLLKHVFTKFKPQIVFHAAAFKHVPLMEQSPSAAVKNNIIATRNLIYASEHYQVESFVFISTDKAVNPSSIMGATKRICEMMLQAKSGKSHTKFMAVRFGNVLGSKGSVVPLFRKQIEEGGPVTVTHPDVRRYFMSISEAVLLVLQASSLGKGGEIFLLDMGEPIKIVDLAKDLISLSGLRLGRDVNIEFTGLRPGEKLYEELFLDRERDMVTNHNKIYISPPWELDPVVLRKQVKELENLAHIMSEEAVVDKIHTILQSFSDVKTAIKDPVIFPELVDSFEEGL
ncbi:MAG: nucleoside-diphosphate sugar epimerase/dehydratase [Candidatus Omnitrophota bacterium]